MPRKQQRPGKGKERMYTSFRDNASRAAFIRGAVAGGAGLALSGIRPPRIFAADDSAKTCPESLPDIFSIALVAEQLATTFYYTALTSSEMRHTRLLGGAFRDPNHPELPPSGNPAHVRSLQAALDAEIQHAAALHAAGGSSPYHHFYFPASTFKINCRAGQMCDLGRSSDPTTFLGVLEALESAFVAAYMTAIRGFIVLGYPSLAELAANIAAVEAEHLAMGRLMVGATPANDVALAAEPFACVSDAATALRPFLTGEGFPHGATGAIPLPSAAQTKPVVGKWHSRIVLRFL